MTYLVADTLASQPAGLRFRALVERPGIARLPGAYNGLSGLQAKAAGFEGLYLSGAAMPASMGLAARAHEELYATLAGEGRAKPVVDRMQTRVELYATIGCHGCEDLDGTIARSVVPQGTPD